NTGQRDSELRTIIEESEFWVLAQCFLIKRPPHILCALDPDEDSNLFSITFPRKLWKIVGSDKFNSIWWDEAGTYIVINEELFKKGLEIKIPFRIFETDSIKNFKNKYFSSDLSNIYNHGLGAAVQISEQSQYSSHTISNVYLRQKPSITQGGSDTMNEIRTCYSHFASRYFTYSISKPIGEAKLPLYKEIVAST
ncbi:hypothetical protein A6R68_13615, partial [Neotoma lepida]